jgi:hypothetical protein
MKRLNGKVAVITGARLFLEQGARVAAVAPVPSERAAGERAP